ncbi:MAG: hypothetical protein J0G94_08560 [Sphingomonadales bacterium]|nr:hypothetical protein [Sphingomonadales bacterium]
MDAGDDMNFLLFREQEELLRARYSRNRDKRDLHEAVARTYARRIAMHRLPYRSRLDDGGCLFNPAPYGSAG